MEKKLALKETELEAALEKARSDEAKAAERTSDNGSSKAIEGLTKALMEAQAEAARLRKLNEELQTALDEARLHGTAGDAAKASKLVAELRKQIEDLKRLLAESQERERHANEKLAGALAQLQAQLDKDDEVDMQRVQWEREKRSELSGLVKDTRERGSQTDIEEQTPKVVSEIRETARTEFSDRARHKPRFMPPEQDDPVLARRPAKPLGWVLRLIRTIYDEKYLADAVDNRYQHPHDSLPEFIFVWTAKRYGLKNLRPRAGT